LKYKTPPVILLCPKNSAKASEVPKINNEVEIVSENKATATQRASWTYDLHKAEANFTARTFSAAAIELNKYTTEGAPKTGTSCKNKFARVV
jgi:hypothetical protein